MAMPQQHETASVTEALRKRVRKARGGTVFYTRRIGEQLGSTEGARKALARLHEEGRLERVGRGFYCKPLRNPYVKRALPSAAELARKQAQARGERLEVHGAQAVRLFGLSTQVPMKTVFHTSGRSRTQEIAGQAITFKHLPERYLRHAGTRVGQAIVALHYLGSRDLTTDLAERVCKQLTPQERGTLQRELSRLPHWMRQHLQPVLNNVTLRA